MQACVQRRGGEAFVSRLHPVITDKELVRIGGDFDGGYLVPDDLDGIVACFSPGVDVTATFEEALLERGIPCFLADASVDAPPIEHPLIDFERKFLGVVNDEVTTTLEFMGVAQAARGRGIPSSDGHRRGRMARPAECFR